MTAGPVLRAALGLALNGSRLCKAGASYAGMDRVQAERRVCARVDRWGRWHEQKKEGDRKCPRGLSQQERQGHLGNVHHGGQSPTAVRDAAPPEQRPSRGEGSRHCGAFHRTQRVIRLAVNGFTHRQHARRYQRCGCRIIKYILDHTTRPTCAILHRNKHATASTAVSTLVAVRRIVMKEKIAARAKRSAAKAPATGASGRKPT